jgi:hypothetical protein
MLNEADEYSYNWHNVKTIPNDIVIIKAFITSCRAFFDPPIIKARCAQVTLTPEDNNITVFNKGKPQGFKTSIPAGGQIQPIATEGAKLQWKKAQKKPKKNITSETINKIIPARNPFCTLSV